MNEPTREPQADQPYFPSGYSPEVEESDTGYSRTLEVQQSAYYGPIPPPESLEYYEHILPGSADRILGMAEQNSQSFRDQAARHLSLDESSEQNRHDETTRGQRFGLFTVLAMCLLAGLAMVKGYEAVAGIICSTTIVAVAAVFVTGRRHAEPAKKDTQQNEKPEDQ